MMGTRVLFFLVVGMVFFRGTAQVPPCTQVNFPADEEINVPVDVEIQWDASPTATSYILNAGTAIGATDIVNNLDVGNVTSYMFPTDLPPVRYIYITITPTNSSGPAVNCTEIRFRTRAIFPPLCTNIIDPTNGAILVPVTSNITWIRDFSATGYRMTIEENFVGGVTHLDNVDVGNGTNYKPPDFKPNTLYFVTLTPYNDLGSATNCQPISFTTGDGVKPLECTRLTMPRNGDINVPTSTGLSWNPVPEATGYILSAGISSGGVDLVNNLDVGNTTSYNFSQLLPEGQRVIISITPYNDEETAQNCIIESFTVEGELVVLSVDSPNFFTPNNDGTNDYWTVIPNQGTTISNVYIFDRYGKLLKQLQEGQVWDGTFNGRPMASDSYWYAIELTDGPTLSGFFTLKR